MIEVASLCHRLGQKQLLSDISFCAPPGTLTAILGANGAGKSTLMCLLAGDCALQEGQIRFAGKPIQSFSTAQMARMRAVLSQQQLVSLPFLVEELVMMGRYPYFQAYPSAHDHNIVMAAMQLTGVLHLQGRVYQTLSGGEQQRVQLARALAQIMHTTHLEPLGHGRPKYLLLDEPITGLDLLHQYQTLELMRKLADLGYVVVTVLHDLNLAAQYADQVLLLHKGRCLAAGTPSEVFTCAYIHQAFGIMVDLVQLPDVAHPLVVCARQQSFLNHHTSKTDSLSVS